MKISKKSGVIIAAIIFLSLLIVGLVVNYKAARKKGKDTLFDFNVPQQVNTK